MSLVQRLYCARSISMGFLLLHQTKFDRCSEGPFPFYWACVWLACIDFPFLDVRASYSPFSLPHHLLFRVISRQSTSSNALSPPTDLNPTPTVWASELQQPSTFSLGGLGPCVKPFTISRSTAIMNGGGGTSFDMATPRSRGPWKLLRVASG